ncbi:hypothetical protein DFH09DRAFT_1088269 [Mycena vulgaris]|nr:hypothetical protein DFH09DRAFT_1088269 [Mycena vulgaris]
MPALRIQDAVSLYGFTYNYALNSYSQSQRPETQTPEGQHIDYILFRNAANPSRTLEPSSVGASVRLVPTDTRVILMECVPGHSFSYSDHFGVEMIFKIEYQAIPAAGFEEPHLTLNPTSKVIEALKTRLKLAHGHTQVLGITLFSEYSVVHRVHFTSSNAYSLPTTSPIPPSHPRTQDPPKRGLFTTLAKTHPDPATELSQNDCLPVGLTVSRPGKTYNKRASFLEVFEGIFAFLVLTRSTRVATAFNTRLIAPGSNMFDLVTLPVKPSHWDHWV